MTLQEAAARFDARKSGAGYKAKCPAHDDQQASLELNQGERGRVLLHCHAGCDTKDVLAAKNLTYQDTFQNSAPKKHRKKKQLWDIKDVHGKLWAIKGRWDDEDGKHYFCHAPGKRTLGDLSSKDLPLYGSERIPTYDKTAPTYLCEGEKDTDSLLRLGVQALGTVTGATSLPTLQILLTLQGFTDLRLWPDNDIRGQEHMQRLQSALHEQGISSQLLSPTSLPPGGGATDWVTRELQEGDLPRAELLRALEALPKGKTLPPSGDDVAGTMPAGKAPDQDKPPTPTALDLEDLLTLPIPPREYLLEPWLKKKDLVEIHAYRGTGKTWVGLSLAYAVASGGEFWRWKAPAPRRVLYVDGENALESLQERLRALSTAALVRPARGFFRVLPADYYEEGLPDLCERPGQELVEQEARAVDLVVLDNLSTLFRSGVENEAESWTPVQDWLLRLKRRGLSVIFFHHSGKNHTQRGTSKHEDVLASVLHLKRPEGYADQEACFEVRVEKNREKKTIPPFEAKLTTDEQGRICWTLRDLEAGLRSRILALAGAGKGNRAICRELGCSSSYVSEVLSRQ